MKKKLLLTTLAGGALLCGAASLSQTNAQTNAQTAPAAATPPMSASLAHWTAMGEGSRLALQKGDENKPTLRFDYQVKPGQFGAIVTPLTPGALANFGSIAMRVKADHATSWIASLEEEGGGRFVAPFSLLKDKWSNVSLAPKDFVLQTGNDDPKDADGKLDLTRVKNMALIDFGQTFAQMATKENSPFAGTPLGAHTLWMDELTISDKALPAAKTEAGAMAIDDFARAQAGWIGVGNVALERANDGALDGPALKMSYNQQEGRVAAVIKPLAADALAGRTGLKFDVVSLERALLIVQLEEVGGGKYNAIVEVPGLATFTPVNLKFADFKVADDSNDTNGKLDLNQVKQLLILDGAGMMKMRAGDNTLWLGAVRAR